MTVFFDKTRRRWRYDFVRAGIRHARECLDSTGVPVGGRRAALEVEAEAKRQAKLPPQTPAAADLTLAEVVNALAETWLTPAQKENNRRYARELLTYAGPAKPIREIDGAWVQDYIAHLTNQPVMIWHGGSGRSPTEPNSAKFWKPAKGSRTRAAASVNRHLPLLRAVFERAYNTRNHITRERAIEEIPKVRDLPEPKRKARPIPDNVLADVREIVPDHINEAIMLTLYFGFRRNEAFNLQIHHVDFVSRGVRLEHTEVKNKEDAFMHGGSAAMDLLDQLVKQAIARGTTYLITWRRYHKDPELQAKIPWTPIKSPKRAWKTAMKSVAQKHGKTWRWHDVRAAYITHIALEMGPIPAQKMARHADFDTTRAYIDVADDLLRRAAERAAARPALAMLNKKRNA